MHVYRIQGDDEHFVIAENIEQALAFFLDAAGHPSPEAYQMLEPVYKIERMPEDYLLTVAGDDVTETRTCGEWAAAGGLGLLCSTGQY